ncbi:MAG TPA: iron ABC transporter substrate-binding protein [Actinomycetota bacterium]|nr:iron ABC transporter substrate-binding protein [Actinomycetota bacterium]
MKLRKLIGTAAAAALVLGLAGCGDDATPAGATEPDDDAGASLTVYSGRDEEFVGPLYEQFETDTGITLDVRYGDSAELAATIMEEGDSSPADVFVSQDAGSLGAVAAEGLLAQIDQEILDRVDERFRSSEGTWVGLSGRARVAAYNTDELTEADLPDSILGFTDPQWKGRIGFAPTNSSFQAFVAGMIATEGEDATREFLEGLVANDPRLYEDNSSTVRGVAAGEIEVGFVNHYYKYEVAAEDGEIPVENHFFTGGDPGALVNAAGAGILTSSKDPDAATRLLDYLTGEQGQTYFAEETWEYPVVDGYAPAVELVALDDIESPEIDLSDLAGTLEPALDLLAEVGLL